MKFLWELKFSVYVYFFIINFSNDITTFIFEDRYFLSKSRMSISGILKRNRSKNLPQKTVSQVSFAVKNVFKLFFFASNNFLIFSQLNC
jgi:hypothetical protein